MTVQDGAEANEPAAIIPRVVSAELDASLERFNDRTLLAAGKVNLISLDAVKTRFGARWAVRQDQVYDFAERVLERGLGPQGLFLRVSTTDFLLVQPDLGRLAGQAACLRYLREIFHHFLGDSALAGQGVLQVTRIGGGQLDAKQVDARAVEKAADEELVGGGGARSSGVAPSETQAPLATSGVPLPQTTSTRAAGRPDSGVRGAGDPAPGDQAATFISSDGRQLRVSATLEPVYELKSLSRIGFRMIRRVIVTRTGEELTPAAIGNLSAADLLRVDLATIGRGLGRLGGDSGGEQQLSLIIPLSYASLSSLRGRAELIQPLREADRLVKCGVICEICDIEGVPSGGLISAVALMRPYALLVVGGLSNPTPSAVNALKGASLRAVSLVSPAGLDDAEYLAWAATTVRLAARLARSVIVYGVANPHRAAQLSQLGVTHVSLARG